MVLAQKQKYRPMEQDREPGDRATYLWVPCFRQRGKNTQWGKDRLLINSAVKTGQLHVKE